jgi:hypothetical protein
MSVEILENEVVIRIPREKYTGELKKVIEQIDTPIKESAYFSDVEAGSELEELLLEVKKERRSYTNDLLKQAGVQGQ